MHLGTSRHGVQIPLLLLSACLAMVGAAEADAVLPAGVTAVWDVAKAAHVTTPTREMICLNGLWRWQPERARPPGSPAVPGEGWGYFKVPGCWPGITDYLQSDCQLVYAHPSWKGENLGAVTSAWYQREISIP